MTFSQHEVRASLQKGGLLSDRVEPNRQVFMNAVGRHWYFLIATTLALFARAVSADQLATQVESLVQHARGKFGVSVVDADSGARLAGSRADEALKPASVLKLLTTLAALRELGPEYTFSTEVWGDERKGGQVKTLYFKAGADPSFTSEALWLLLRRLKLFGIRKIDRLAFDISAFSGGKPRQGQRAFQTASAPLSFNFNSIAIHACPGAVGNPAIVNTDPWESGIDVRSTVRTVSRGAQGVSVEEERGGYVARGSLVTGGECIIRYRSVSDPLSYLAHTLHSFAGSLGIEIPSRHSLLSTQPGSAILFRHASRPLSGILQDLNHFSNNFIAEQLLFAIGAAADGQSYDQERGLDKLRALLESYGYSERDFVIVDGSGLNHANRLSAAMVTDVLIDARRDPRIGVEFVNSLSVSGRNGTLKERDFDLTGQVRAKTGTLDGVSSLAGYVVNKKGRTLAFAIIGNELTSKERAVELENRVVDLLYRS